MKHFPHKDNSHKSWNESSESTLVNSYDKSSRAGTQDNCQNCFGVKKTKNDIKCTVYHGNLTNGKMDGMGRLKIKSTESVINLCGLNDFRSRSEEITYLEIEGHFQQDKVEGCQGYANRMQYWIGDELLWTYHGDFDNSLPHGEGTCTFHHLQDIIYDGSWSHGQMVWGSATIDHDIGGQEKYYYIGDFKGGCPGGVGRVEYANGDVYEGEWYQGQPHGDGRMVYSTGDIYDGQFNEGFLEGFGRMDYKEKCIYIGSWKSNTRSGLGRMIFQDQDSFQGTWKNNDMVEGTMYFQSSLDKYEGTFKDMNLDGYGTMWYSDGDIYQGEFKDGEYHGKGQLTFSTGESYCGEWEYGERNGFGTLRHNNGEKAQILLFMTAFY